MTHYGRYKNTLTTESNDSTSMAKKKTKNAPSARNGPNGISLFIVMPRGTKDNRRGKNAAMRSVMSRKIAMRAPIQNASITAATPWEIPRSQPMPRESFASPKPIQRPWEKNQRSANGRARRGPAKKS